MISLAIIEWIQKANAILAHYNKKQSPPLKHAAHHRWACYLCGIPVGCFPCLLWSTIWRLIACPCVCLCKGGIYACSDNGCTTMTDKCIGDTIDEVQSIIKLEAIPTPITDEDKQALNEFYDGFKSVLVISNHLYTANQYKICEAVFSGTIPNGAATPYSVTEYIKTAQQQFGLANTA